MGSTPRILIIDDDQSIRASWQKALRYVGFAAELAATLQEGLDKLEGHKLVLADLNLPDGQSTATLRKVREMGWQIRVAIITGSHDGMAVIDASGERPDAFFQKPLELQRLLDWITDGTS